MFSTTLHTKDKFHICQALLNTQGDHVYQISTVQKILLTFGLKNHTFGTNPHLS